MVVSSLCLDSAGHCTATGVVVVAPSTANESPVGRVVTVTVWLVIGLKDNVTLLGAPMFTDVVGSPVGVTSPPKPPCVYPVPGCEVIKTFVPGA